MPGGGDRAALAWRLNAWGMTNPWIMEQAIDEVGAIMNRPQWAPMQMVLFVCSACKRPCSCVHVWYIPLAITNRPQCALM